MGQTVSKSCTPPPLCLRDCLANGHIDLAKYRLYSKRKCDDEEYIDIATQQKMYLKRKIGNEEGPKKKKSCHSCRTVKCHPILFHAEDGNARDVTCEDSAWYCLYIVSPPEGERLNKIFRRRFRLPYSVFI